MSSVVLKINPSPTFSAFEQGKAVASDAHRYVGDVLNQLADQGMKWSVNPVAATFYSGACLLAAIAATKGFTALSAAKVTHAFGWSMLVSGAAEVIYHAGPRVFSVKG